MTTLPLSHCNLLQPFNASRWRRAWISSLGRFDSRCLEANDTFLVRYRFDALSDSCEFILLLFPPGSLPQHGTVAGSSVANEGVAESMGLRPVQPPAAERQTSRPV
ncbi:unnamed protein product [Pleuronectes platessa]|uniref:Uncharacterized protein n=1 Tax=Pleuronectes platessa TaxID=8262 RepID=A0A9N7V9Q1_PLEPL|nr:unnamed protein product [Pleuronectes platessa]